MIRVIDYLDSRGQDYKYRGNNVGSNDVNIDCPFCGETNKHLGIHKSKGTLHCWVCKLEWTENGKYPRFVDLIQIIDNCSSEQARIIFNEFSDDIESEESVNFERAKKTLWPEQMENIIPLTQKSKTAYEYLKGRGFGKYEIEKYDLRYCVAGRFGLRIIAPVYRDKELVTYVGRDYMGMSDNRYKNCPAKLSICNPSEVLYGQDDFVGPHLRIVEGVTDKWRMDDCNTLATFTARVSRAQRNWIVKNLYRIESISIIYDRDAFSKALAAMEELSIYVDRIKVVELKDFKDPAVAGKNAILELESMTRWN